MTAVGPGTTSFSVRGFRNGSVVSVTWDRGSLYGDPPTIDLIEVEVELARVGKNDPNFARSGSLITGDNTDLLADAESALNVIQQVVDRITEITPTSQRED